MQLIAFGNEVEQFFIAKLDNEPLPGHEESVTEAIYQAALQSRMSGGKPRDYTIYKPIEQDADMDKTDYARGYSDGYAGDNDANLFRESRNRDYQDGYTDGKAKRIGEHRSRVEVVVWSRGMLIAADCRVIRGSFNKGA